MANYSVAFARSARKELESLPNILVNKIFLRIETLSKKPRPSGCKQLRGFQNLWRIRIGDYRVIYSIDDSAQKVDITAIRHRSEAFK